MCTGLEIAALAAMAGGTGMGMAASSMEKGAMNQATQDELNRQQEYARKGQAAFEKSFEQSTPEAVAAQQAAGATKAAQEYTKLQNQDVLGKGLQSQWGAVSPNEQLVATENALVGGRVGQQNTAAARLQGYGQSALDQQLKDQEARTQLGQISQFAQASQNVLPLELQAAQNSQAGLAGAGQLLTTAGSLAGLYGMMSPAAAPGALTSGQGAAFQAGFGPVSAAKAASIPYSTLAPYYTSNTLAGLGYGSPLSTGAYGGFGSTGYGSYGGYR
jgi:hypothetical protein